MINAVPSRLRIIHCFRSPVGGVFRNVRDLALAQTARGHAVGIICDSTTGGPLEEQIIASIAPQLELGLKRLPMRRQLSLSDLWAARAVYREVSSLSPHIMHGHGAKGGAYARMIGTLLRASGIRVARIYTPHGGSLHYDPASLKGGGYLFLERQLEKMSDGLIFVSNFEATAYSVKVRTPLKPTAIVLNGLADAEFDPVEPAADAADFLFVGTLRELKGPDVLIDAIAFLRTRRGTAPTAVFVGDGDPSPYLALVGARGLRDAVTFRDPMPVRNALRLGRSLVVPSRAESMPYIVLEAAAAGMPMIATNVGGIPEILPERDLVPPGDATALANRLEAHLADPAGARQEAARIRLEIRPRFSIGRMAAEVETFYRRLAEEAAETGR